MRLYAWQDFHPQGCNRSVISFQLPNWIETAVISLAARMAGLVINPLPTMFQESEVEYILNDCRSQLVFVPETFRDFEVPRHVCAHA